MNRNGIPEPYSDLVSKLKIDCAKCSGLCCVALFCTKTDGFPKDKAAGTPCKNLMPDFRCAIHAQLASAKMRGCLSYDCFGAGQRVTQIFHPDRHWMKYPERANDIFAVFLIVFQLHQMLWYLIQAFSGLSDGHLAPEIERLILENEQMTSKSVEELLLLDLEPYRLNVNQILKQAIERTACPHARGGNRKDYLGKDFKKANLVGGDFSMALMIAANLEGCRLCGANFLGADMRDANIRNTDLSECAFLTQMQINSAKGNANTRIPVYLSRPADW